MALKKRIVVTLCHDGKGNAIKPVGFDRNTDRNVGSLMQHIKVLSKRSIDELVLLDIDASIEKREQNYDLLKEVSSHITCPLAVGGNISSKKAIREAMQSGADKVVIRSAFMKNKFIEEASKYVGAQSIVLAIDLAFWAGEMTYAKLAELLVIQTSMCTYSLKGVGEFIITCTKADGSMQGYDINLARFLKSCPYVTILNGGAGSAEHMLEAFKHGASNVAASSMFLYTDTTPRDCAEYLSKHGVDVRNDPIEKFKAWSGK